MSASIYTYTCCYCHLSTVVSGAVPLFHPEYGRYMLESTPGAPYTGSLPDLLSVERNMRYRYLIHVLHYLPFLSVVLLPRVLSRHRRKLTQRYLKPHEVPLTITSFPRLGSPGVFTDPYFDPANAIASHSLFLPDEITNPHARFPYVVLTLLIMKRKFDALSAL